MRNKTRISVLAFAVTALVLSSANASAGNWDAELAKGKIFVTTRNVGGNTPEVKVTAVINAAPDKVWALVTNCNRFSTTMPRIKASKELWRKGSKVACTVTVDLPWPLSDLTSTTLATHTVKADYRARVWKLVSGDYTQNRGSWVLRPFKGDKNRTHVEYTVHAEPKTWIPAWIRARAQKSTMPGIIKRLRKLLGVSVS
ncbi:MAG: SRPBCC family protein [Myxococcales bacterium]|nr:SRPBCC family protein [Myxococcales bacterium]